MDYLKQVGAQSGESAYDQIKNLLLKLFKERPPQRRVYAEFEELTAQLRDLTLPRGARVPGAREAAAKCYAQLQFDPPAERDPDAEDEEAPADAAENGEEEQ